MMRTGACLEGADNVGDVDGDGDATAVRLSHTMICPSRDPLANRSAVTTVSNSEKIQPRAEPHSLVHVRGFAGLTQTAFTLCSCPTNCVTTFWDATSQTQHDMSPDAVTRRDPSSDHFTSNTALLCVHTRATLFIASCRWQSSSVTKPSSSAAASNGAPRPGRKATENGGASSASAVCAAGKQQNRSRSRRCVAARRALQLAVPENTHDCRTRHAWASDRHSPA